MIASPGRRSALRDHLRPLRQFRAVGLRAGRVGLSLVYDRPAAGQSLPGPVLNEFPRTRASTFCRRRGARREIDRMLAAGGILALLADQYAGAKGAGSIFSAGRPRATRRSRCFRWAPMRPTMFCYARRPGRPLRHEMGSRRILDPRHHARRNADRDRRDRVVYSPPGAHDSPMRPNNTGGCTAAGEIASARKKRTSPARAPSECGTRPSPMPDVSPEWLPCPIGPAEARRANVPGRPPRAWWPASA